MTKTQKKKYPNGRKSPPLGNATNIPFLGHFLNWRAKINPRARMWAEQEKIRVIVQAAGETL